MTPAQGATLLMKWILAAGVGYLPIRAIIGGWIDGRLAAWEAMLLLTGVIGLLGAAVACNNTFLYFFILLLIGAIWLAGHLAEQKFVKKLDDGMLADDLIRYQEAIARDPKNAAAYFFLAETYRKQGRWEAAIEQYEKSLEVDPNQKRVEQRLREVSEEKMLRETGQVRCPRCLTISPKETKVCPQCGYAFSVLEDLRAWVRGGDLRPVIKTTAIIMAGVMAFVIFARIIRGIAPFAGMILILLALFAAVALFLVWVFRQS